MRAIELVVHGVPIVEGNLNMGRSGRMYHRNAKELKPWRELIAGVAHDAMAGSLPLEGPVRLDVTFVMPRPASHYLPANGRRSARILRADAAVWHSTSPDVDKLVRACGDALTGVAYRDDGQIADLRARTVFADPLEVGALIRVSSLPVTA